VLVHLDETAVVGGDAGSAEVELGGGGNAAHRDEHGIGLERAGAARTAERHGRAGTVLAVVVVPDGLHALAEPHADALLLQERPDGMGDSPQAPLDGRTALGRFTGAP
jgi:hypothetical protein